MRANRLLLRFMRDADEAELFVNGKSVERKKIGEKKKFIAYFETTYEARRSGGCCLQERRGDREETRL